MHSPPRLPEAFRLPDEVHDEALELFRALLRLDTGNPPGNERPAAELLADWLSDRGLEPRLHEPEPGRTSLVCRLEGSGDAGGPLLLNGHLDVVPAEPEHWTHPPFSAAVADGWIWGRGAIDMKQMVAMSALVLWLLKEEGGTPGRTVVLAAVADEETGGSKGSAWLADEHPDEVRAELAIGEVGGFPVWTGGRPFFPVMVAEKGVAWLQARCTGEPGHGSIPHRDNAVVHLAEAIARIGKRTPNARTYTSVRVFTKSLLRVCRTLSSRRSKSPYNRSPYPPSMLRDIPSTVFRDLRIYPGRCPPRCPDGRV